MHRLRSLLGSAFVLTLLLGWAHPATAGTIDPALERHLATLGPAENVSVLVMLADQVPIAELDQELRVERATLPVRHERVITELKAVADATQPPLVAELETRRGRGEVSGFTPYWIGNLVVVQMTAKAVREVAARPYVGTVYANFTVSLIEPVGGVPIAPPLPADGQSVLVNSATPGLRAINAHRVWAELGITGAGRLVCGLDTGVFGSHVALASRWRGTHVPWQQAWKDVLGGGTQFPSDSDGHGTHTMGTMVGLGAATGDTVGVAFGAEWIACNAIHQNVGLPEFGNDVIAAFQWIADPDGNAQTEDDVPDVVQNSWRIHEGFPGGYTDCDPSWWAVIDAVEAAGCAVVFSAGNEGPSAGTIGSPPDRITTPTNGFAIGAVDARAGIPFPFPILHYSSRGPSGCPGSVTQRIKPEVVGPGVEVYSTLRNGGYGSNWTGTSMAGPHVSGIIALMREADPNLPVSIMKQVIMDTARDLGPAGEDNSFGWGIPDAFEAVSLVMAGLGEISGTVVREGSRAGGSTPIAGATVTVVGTGRSFLTNAQGNFSGFAPHGTHNVTASHPIYQSETVNGVVISDTPVVVNFALLPVPDLVAPAISHTCPFASESSVGPYEVSAIVTDNLWMLDTVVLNYRVGGPFITVAMLPTGDDRYASSIPGQPLGTTVEYYVEAWDIQQNVGLDPPAAPLAVHHLVVDTPTTVVNDDAELDRGWTLGVTGDQATTGRWVREDPVGTSNPSPPFIGQPEDDHTPNPGVICFITGNAPPGSGVGTNDVDAGCTTLLSPIYDLTGAHEAVVHYWRWYTDEDTPDDTLTVDISSDGGTTWQPFERVGPGTVQPWLEVTKALRCEGVDLTSQMRFRFVACDRLSGSPSGSTTEAGIDDLKLVRFESPTTALSPEAAPAAALRIVAVRPNPFNPAALVTYEVPRREAVQLKIFDVAGRLLKTLADGAVEPGVHSSLFDGRATDGQELASGVYFLELTAGGQRLTKKVSVVR